MLRCANGMRSVPDADNAAAAAARNIKNKCRKRKNRCFGNGFFVILRDRAHSGTARFFFTPVSAETALTASFWVWPCSTRRRTASAAEARRSASSCSVSGSSGAPSRMSTNSPRARWRQSRQPPRRASCGASAHAAWSARARVTAAVAAEGVAQVAQRCTQLVRCFVEDHRAFFALQSVQVLSAGLLLTDRKLQSTSVRSADRMPPARRPPHSSPESG